MYPLGIGISFCPDKYGSRLFATVPSIAFVPTSAGLSLVGIHIGNMSPLAVRSRTMKYCLSRCWFPSVSMYSCVIAARGTGPGGYLGEALLAHPIFSYSRLSLSLLTSLLN